MKKILLFLALIAINLSCSDDITNLNEDTKNPTSAKPEFLFTNAQKTLVDQMSSTSVNFNVFKLFSQYWTETTYLDESQYNIATRTIPDNHFQTLYRDVLRDFKEARMLLDNQPALTASEIAISNNKKAIIDIMMVYTYSVLVDTFGDVPYSEALDIEAHPLPKYDDAKTIYKNLISRLTSSVSMLSSSDDSFGTADLIYGGNSASWKKFANSLRLRLAINMDDIDHAYAITEISLAINAGLISSNSENANLNYLSAQPNTNPLYVDLVASGRNDFVPANTIINFMNNLTDPRREKYFTFKPGTTVYLGGTYGYTSPYNSYSHINPTLTDPTFPGKLFDYAEVEFLLAEAVERGISTIGTAETHYNNAITASMSDWGVAAADITAYLANASVAYSTATGTWRQKIGEQAWLGLYSRGFEAWTSYRRLNFPVLVAPANAYNNLTEVPKRYTYPAREQTLNTANVNSASTAIGGNTLTTKIFWDVN